MNTPDESVERLHAECLRLFVHDMNNPLTAIRILAEVARDDAPSAELRQDLVDIQEAADMASALTDGLASMTRQNENENYTWFPIDLVAVLRTTIDRPALRRHVRLELPPRLRLNGDGAALQRAFTDILVNARRLVERHDVLVTAEEHLDHVEVRVRHNVPDPGTVEDLRAQRFAALFEPYGGVQLRRERCSVSATGLAYARRVVERHAGSLSFEGRGRDGLDLVAVLALRGAEPNRPA